jgi:DNA modification methylase
MTPASAIVRSDTALDTVMHGDCIKVMSRMASAAVDFVLTDPPYIARYRSRTGQSVINDDNGAWLQPAFTQMYRLLKPGSFCVSFYGWSKADRFIAAWRSAGFRMVGHLVFRKKYASSARFLRYQHEQAYLLAKGDVAPPAAPMPDVLDWTYTGNRLHPTQKPVQVLRPLIDAFCRPGGIVLDPFCGSGSTLVAARELARRFVGIELDRTHYLTAARRLREAAIRSR